MVDLNGSAVQVDAIAADSRIRLIGPGGATVEGVVARLDASGLGWFRELDTLGKQADELTLFHPRNVTGLGLVCDRAGPLPAPCWALDFIDFPTGWHIQRQGVIHVDRQCSAVQAWGGFLCDCGAIQAEWSRRRAGMPDVQKGVPA